MKYTFSARGHKNILATHKNTLEFTKDNELSLDGDCILGVKADFSLVELQKLAKGNNKLRMRISAGGVSDTVEFETNKGFSSDRELVLRYSEFSSDRTFGFRATKAANQLDRKLVENMADPAQEMTIDIESMTKVIIFDFDDTLSEFREAAEGAHKKISELMLERHNVYEPTTMKIMYDVDRMFSINGIHGKPLMFDRHNWFKEYFNRIGIDARPEEIDEMVRVYWETVNSAARPLPGAIETLNSLKRSYKIAAITNSDGEKKIKMERAERTGLMKLFDLFMTSDETGINKPDMTFYSKIFSTFGVKADECVMVGDNPEGDLKLAKELGMTTVWIRHGHWPQVFKTKPEYADHEITELSQLLGML
jgi:putative hydrolase of the HAD superfamily